VTAHLAISRVVDWYCPNCGATDQTRETKPHTRMHICQKLHGLTAPMLQAGVTAKVTAIPRQDYEGPDAGRTTKGDDGRPYMSVVTERDHGQDTAVFAPVANASADI
jgi:hypothetical protein